MSEKQKIFVCSKGKKCCKRGGPELAAALAAELQKQPCAAGLSLKEVKCLDLCKHAPAVLVNPGKVRYGKLSASDAAEIVEAHAKGSEPLAKFQVKKKKN